MNNILNALVGKAEDMWPAIKYKNGGSRAQSAAGLVASGVVLPIGNGLFSVGDYTASWQDNHCDCLDRAPEDPKLGKLCKHRLAIMFKLSKAMSGHNAWLNEKVAEVAALATNGWFELILESNYDRPDIKRLVGYSLNGATTKRFTDTADVTVEQLHNAIDPLGLGLVKMPQKLKGWNYAFRFSPDGKAKLHEMTWNRKGITPEMVERNKWQMPKADAAAARQEIRAVNWNK